MKHNSEEISTIRIMELRGTYKGGGGPDKTILLSAKYHDKRFFVLVTYLRSPGDHEFQIGKKAKDLGLRHYVEVEDRSMLDLSCLFQLSSLIRKHYIQIIHVHDLKTTLLGLLLKLLNPGIKIMQTAHGWIVNSKTDKIKQKLQAWMLRFYPLHIAVSLATKMILLKYSIPPEKIKLLYNAIDVDTWQRNGEVSTIRKEFGLNEDCFIIGSVGRLSLEKDLPTLLQVAKRVLQTIPNSYFIIAGDGKQDEFTYYRNLTNELGIGKVVILTGHRNDLKNLYLSFDIFLSTSLSEGLPNTILEAMAMEVPVIATRVGGVPELVIDNKTGMLCEPGDITGITEKVMQLFGDKNKTSRITTMARKRIEEKFSFDNRLKNIEEYYKELVSD